MAPRGQGATLFSPRPGVRQTEARRKFAPRRGIIDWNSRAFNLTGSEHRLHAWQNYSFAKQRTFPIPSIVDSDAIYIQAGQAPFTTQHHCSTHEMPRGAELIYLSSHTHKRGHHFTVTT